MSDSTTKLLQKLQSGEITMEECQKGLKAARPAAGAPTVTYKVSTKGCISFYGIRRIPISLYLQELEKVLNVVLDVSDSDSGIPYGQAFSNFLEENKGKLSIKE